MYECALVINCKATASSVIHIFISRLQSDEPKKISRQHKQNALQITLFQCSSLPPTPKKKKNLIWRSYRFEIWGFVQSDVNREEIECRRHRQKKRETRRPKHARKKEGKSQNPWCKLHVFYSLVCLHEQQRSEMEKCHLASISLRLSSPFRSERRGGGTFKKSFKGLWAFFCLWNHPITHFYQHWTCKTRSNSTSEKKKKRESELSLNLNFKNCPAKGRPDFSSWLLKDAHMWNFARCRKKWRAKLKENIFLSFIPRSVDGHCLDHFQVETPLCAIYCYCIFLKLQELSYI